jgi:hypothetical protein
MIDSGAEPLPRLLTTRNRAVKKIADRIRAFEYFRTSITKGQVRDLEAELELQRQYTVELLRSLFDSPRPATEFDDGTARSVFYANTPDDERRTNMDDEVHQCITQLRSLTARLEFYQSAAKSAESDPAPSLVAIVLFVLILLGTATLVLWKQDAIARTQGAAAVLLYLVSALLPAILLFGTFRTVAKITGKLYGLPIELGGPAALFIIVLWLLLKIAPIIPYQPAPPSITGTTIPTR